MVVGAPRRRWWPSRCCSSGCSGCATRGCDLRDELHASGGSHGRGRPMSAPDRFWFLFAAYGAIWILLGALPDAPRTASSGPRARAARARSPRCRARRRPEPRAGDVPERRVTRMTVRARWHLRDASSRSPGVADLRFSRRSAPLGVATAERRGIGLARFPLVRRTLPRGLAVDRSHGAPADRGRQARGVRPRRHQPVALRDPAPHRPDRGRGHARCSATSVVSPCRGCR